MIKEQTQGSCKIIVHTQGLCMTQIDGPVAHNESNGAISQRQLTGIVIPNTSSHRISAMDRSISTSICTAIQVSQPPISERGYG